MSHKVEYRMETISKKSISSNIARDRTTKVITRYVENLAVPAKAFGGLRDTLTSGSERNTKKFFERMSMQLFHIIFTMYEYINPEEKILIHQILCSMYPVDMEKVENLLRGQELVAEVESEIVSDGENVVSVTELGPQIIAVEPIREIQPVAIKSKWAKNIHLRKRDELVTLCGVDLQNKDVRTRQDGLKMCNKCQKKVHKVKEEQEDA